MSPDAYRYESTLTLRQPLLKDTGKYTLSAISGSSANQFSFTLKVKGTEKGVNQQTNKQTVNSSAAHGSSPPSAPTAAMFPPSAAPLLLPRVEEMVVPLHGAFSLTCRGEAKLAWEMPLDVEERTQEDNSGMFVTTVTVDEATVMHTGYYTCSYSHNATAEDAEESSIYVYVPGVRTRGRGLKWFATDLRVACSIAFCVCCCWFVVIIAQQSTCTQFNNFKKD